MNIPNQSAKIDCLITNPCMAMVQPLILQVTILYFDIDRSLLKFRVGRKLQSFAQGAWIKVIICLDFSVSNLSFALAFSYIFHFD